MTSQHPKLVFRLIKKQIITILCYPKTIFLLSNQRQKACSYILLTDCLLVSSADNLCNKFGPRSGLTKRRALSGSKLFDTKLVFLKEYFLSFFFEKQISRRLISMKNLDGRIHLYINFYFSTGHRQRSRWNSEF